MSKKDKLIQRLKSRPKDFTWDEMTQVLSFAGFKEAKKGKTGGSRRKFINVEGVVIILHKPHPSKIVKGYAVEQVLELLKREKLI